ncbi:endonuclease/exonuclease/phosphatase family protein [Kitasatospora atroaurantiaca]|uniref:Vancomycin resistance protein VanJ n=1 Tax=Kitasatospora atroaurantiaca TaxID=285545 RepID=A0A561EMB2_9ACTN|nr:endonuclease/exonuclease/phosphatase family protein [Kitasatospora atroaurantiaca]TWE16761.1 vancomycin resistance protein VanJ [Kitasatospora atroaurantiaca]
MAQTEKAVAPADGGEPAPSDQAPRSGRADWRRGWILTVLAVLTAGLLAFHSWVPNGIGNLGSLLETFLPWLGLAVPVLLALALWRRAPTAMAAVLLPAIVWVNLFGGLVTDKSTGKGDFTVLTHNVAAANTDRAGTLKLLNGSGAQIVALEELASGAVPAYTKGLAATYPYHAVEGTVGLWSKYPLDDVSVVDIKIGWTRAFRATVTTPQGPLAVYVAHLPSVRVKFDSGFTAGQRDASAQALGDAIEAERLKKVLLLGDLNGTMNDRSLAPVTSQLRSAQGAAGDGFGFSWPAAFPMARIDQILSKGGLKPTNSWVLPPDGSDHRAVAADFKY